jgi:protein SCO1/2
MQGQHLKTSRRRRFIMVLSITVMAAAAGVALGLILPALRQSEMTALTLLPEPRPVGDFQLRDHGGRPFGIQDLRGRWSLLFFGFTNCLTSAPVRSMT